MELSHQPVLLQEVMTYLAIKSDGLYVDATFGRGGHSKEILQRLGEKGFLLAIDRDPSAVEFARKNISDARFQIRQGPFSMMETFVSELQLANKVDGILLDLGVSSPQLDEADRGFSFLKEGPLDMRMDKNQAMDATAWINNAPETEIMHILWEYGEEKYAKRIARAITRAREIKPITRTTQLATIVAEANPAWEKHKHPATRSFQAIRIHINSELQELANCLEQSLAALTVGGRLAVISFHSLEDSIVKKFIQHQQQGGDFPRDLPLTKENFAPRMKRVAWGIKAGDQEIRENPRSRSAILRVAEKIQ